MQRSNTIGKHEYISSTVGVDLDCSNFHKDTSEPPLQISTKQIITARLVVSFSIACRRMTSLPIEWLTHNRHNNRISVESNSTAHIWKWKFVLYTREISNDWTISDCEIVFVVKAIPSVFLGIDYNAMAREWVNRVTRRENAIFIILLWLEDSLTSQKLKLK